MPDPLFDVSGKVAVVTGGLGQLGRQFTLGLLQRGARVAIFDLEVDADWSESGSAHIVTIPTC